MLLVTKCKKYLEVNPLWNTYMDNNTVCHRDVLFGGMESISYNKCCDVKNDVSMEIVITDAIEPTQNINLKSTPFKYQV